MEEANEEAEHKGWCDEQLSVNEQTRKEQTEELTKAIEALDAAMAKATKIRLAEKAKNKETIQDAKDGQTAVAQAIVILKEFYEKAGEATALVQQEPPAIFDSPYKGMQP